MNLTDRIQQFLQYDLWAQTTPNTRPALRTLRWMLQRLVVTVECFIQNNLANYAAALTYSGLLAAVPILSIIFAIARGFGFGPVLEERLREYLQTNSELGNHVIDFIDHYLKYTHSGVFLGAGLLLLLFTVLTLTANIETTFNTIWHVRSSRNIYRQIINYAAIFLLLPLLIVVTSGLRVFMLTMLSELSHYALVSGTMEIVINYTPLLLACLSFMMLYKLMPNTYVRWRSVLFPGLLAGLLFQFVQYLYIHYQLMLSSYNAIYGSFAALPLFMLWMQISWYICLAGAQLSFALQRSDEYIFSKDSEQLPRLDHDSLCLFLMAHIARRFRQAQPALTVHQLSKKTRLPHSLVQGLADELVSVGLLCDIANEATNESAYQPNMDIQRITVNHVVRQLDSGGKGHLPATWTAGNTGWKNILRQRSAFVTPAGDICVADLEV